MNPSIFFITGKSGAGKTTLVNNLRKEQADLIVYDFDEVGVPSNVDEQWRLDTTEHWIQTSKEHLAQGSSVAIIGLSLPDEVRNSPGFSEQLPVRFGYIKVSDADMRQRLQERGWDQTRIEQSMNWSSKLEGRVLQEKDVFVVDGSTNTPEQVVQEIQWWMRREAMVPKEPRHIKR